MSISNHHSAIYSKVRKIAPEQRTLAQRTFFAIMDFRGEVNNGGLDQYFRNSTGVDAPIMEACFREIGAEKFADLARQAFDIVDGQTIDWANDSVRKQRILDMSDDAWDQLEDLNVIFWNDHDEFEPQLEAFVEAHPVDLDWKPASGSWPRLRSLQGTIGATDGFRGTMATQPDIPPPDTITPVAPPEIPVDPEPSQAPMTEPPGIEPPMPDQDQPDPGLPDIPPPPD